MSLNPSLRLPAEPRIAAVVEFPSPPSRLAETLHDLAAGFARHWIWSALAYQDMRIRYRGSVLGPFWVTLTNLILVAALGSIYGVLFHIETTTYIPFLLAGLPIWQFVSTVIIEGCDTFFVARDIIPQVPLPFSIHAYRTVYRNLIVLAHTALIIPFGLIVFSVPTTWRLIEVPAGLLVLCVNGLWLNLLLGTISARFRDVPQIVANVVQVVFFITPIFWPLEAAGPWQPYLVYNPFFAALDVIRAPLLGGAAQPSSWPLLLICTAVGSLIGLAFFARFRERIAYWV
jgi:ABC-2 type transport system permease protein/lipopolysaccharide transport system permease protein